MTLTAARNPATAAYVSSERVYADKDGKIVGENDPSRVTLVVAKGGTISHARARMYGLVQPTDEERAAEKEAAGSGTPVRSGATSATGTPLHGESTQPITGDTVAPPTVGVATETDTPTGSPAEAKRPKAKRSGGSRKK